VPHWFGPADGKTVELLSLLAARASASTGFQPGGETALVWQWSDSSL